ncbi:Hypothetical protein A7982_11876 [Minicystis rosea]|nr:Hypothetical protein A7982_11876 [Minicystis rosea]
MVARAEGANRRPLLAGLIAGWIVAVAFGVWQLQRYHNTPSPTHERAAPALWPSASGLVASPDRPTLVMFAHPRCTCSRASLGELEEVMARLGAGVTAYVVFYRPSPAPAGWDDSELWRRAQSIRGVEARWDDDGREAARFSASVSGQTLLYDREGQLRFAGGITGSRGHLGDNLGRRRVLAFFSSSSGKADDREAPVFGCSIE